jgi:hypothetical protein
LVTVPHVLLAPHLHYRLGRLRHAELAKATVVVQVILLVTAAAGTLHIRPPLLAVRHRLYCLLGRLRHVELAKATEVVVAASPLVTVLA